MEEKVFLLFILCVTAQPQFMPEIKPDRCNRPAEFMYRQCCIFPPFFTRDIAKTCGAMFQLMATDKINQITSIRRHPLTTCDHWKCMLQKYSLLTQDNNLDDVKYYAHLDRWVELNPSFTAVMVGAKRHCKEAYRMYLPLKVCEFFDIHGCIRNFINVNCPVSFPTKECYEKSEFYKECSEFYV